MSSKEPQRETKSGKESETSFSDKIQSCKALLEVLRFPENKIFLRTKQLANISLNNIRVKTFILLIINRLMITLKTVYAELKVVTICRVISPIHRKVGLKDPILVS